MTVEQTPLIPKRFARHVPNACRQVVLVMGDAETSSHGTLWLLERNGPSVAWISTLGPFPVDLGRNGMTWAGGADQPAPPRGARMKREGDGCCPAGVFRIPFAFGYAPAAPDIRLKYMPLTPASVGVDDTRSRYYNQVVDSRTVTPDWKRGEKMFRTDGIYRRGAFVGFNPSNIPGRGSCIFLHIRHNPRHATIGCTAMSEKNLLRLLERLDPAREPRLVQTCRGW